VEKYYKTLDLSTSATASEIRQAYRDLVKVWHPDRFANDIKLQKKAEEKLKEINVAYENIINHLNNVDKQETYRRTDARNAPSYQASSNSHNSWMCPECLKTNLSNYHSCICGFKTNEFDIRAYRATQSASELYEDILFNRRMNDINRAEFLTKYLLKRFPTSPQADMVRRSPSSAPFTKHNKKEDKLYSYFKKIGLKFNHKYKDALLHFKKYWGWYLLFGIFLFGYLTRD
jgi:curved DNA-binding protein CbpA